jgi:hypothetical protein
VLRLDKKVSAVDKKMQAAVNYAVGQMIEAAFTSLNDRIITFEER